MTRFQVWVPRGDDGWMGCPNVVKVVKVWTFGGYVLFFFFNSQVHGWQASKQASKRATRIEK